MLVATETMRIKYFSNANIDEIVLKYFMIRSNDNYNAVEICIFIW